MAVPRALPPSTPRPARTNEPPRQRGLRALTEWLVLLALAVTLFRAFALEGYMISTGSMAPCLLGYHRSIVCPACRHVFAYGVPLTADEPAAESRVAQAAGPTAATISESSAETLACPNCGKSGLGIDSLPRTEGDQLLVHKDAFAWRRLLQQTGPRRWEVAVFRNPSDATMAYVKRVAGLPGERIELRRGEVFANGELQRKPFTAQLGTRIPLTVHDELPDDDDPDWQPRWIVATNSSWQADGSRFVFRRSGQTGGTLAPNATRPMEWVTYRHWIRRGGTHDTEVELADWPEGLSPPNPLLSQLEYDQQRGRLMCYGALAWPQWERWEAASDSEEFQDAVWRLYRESHVAPITDALAYNPEPAAADTFPVHDLMLELTLTWSGGAGVFAVEITDGSQVFDVEVDFGAAEVRVRVDDSAEPVRTAVLRSLRRSVPFQLTVSTFDRQLLVAIDDELVLEPLLLDDDLSVAAPLRRPVRFGAQGADVTAEHLVLYRDVYYRPAEDGENRDFEVGPGEYFMLGDNSAVSVDSRHWERVGVPQEMLIGKPLIVHLPSRPGSLEWGGERRSIRVPDFSRIRYIR